MIIDICLEQECLLSPEDNFEDLCEFTGEPPTNNCPPNEVEVSCDPCAEAFCCDSGMDFSLKLLQSIISLMSLMLYSPKKNHGVVKAEW